MDTKNIIKSFPLSNLLSKAKNLPPKKNLKLSPYKSLRDYTGQALLVLDVVENMVFLLFVLKTRLQLHGKSAQLACQA